LFIWDKIRKRISKSDESIFSWEYFGIESKGLEKSLKLGLLMLPIMLITTFLVTYIIGMKFYSDFPLGVVYFVESFTEEFFFRGILFLFLMRRTNLQVAYVTSFTSFVLMHSQYYINFINPFIIITIIQGFLTLEICRRSKNLLGAWVLHGTNRFFSIVIIPFLL